MSAMSKERSVQQLVLPQLLYTHSVPTQPRYKYFSMAIFSSNCWESPNSVITKGTEMGPSTGGIHLPKGHSKCRSASLLSLMLLGVSRVPAGRPHCLLCRHLGNCPQPGKGGALLCCLPLRCSGTLKLLFLLLQRLIC